MRILFSRSTVTGQISIIALLASLFSFPFAPIAHATPIVDERISIFSGPNDVEVRDLVIDSLENIYATGDFVGQADLDLNTSNVDTLASTSNDMDAFITKIDSSGIHSWTHRLGGALPDTGRAIALNSAGDVYVAGMFSDNLVVGTNPIITTKGHSDIFIVKISGSTGEFQWVKAIGGTDRDTVSDLAINSSGELYLTGTFRGNTDFDPNAGIQQFNPQNADDDIFILKLNSDGEFVAANRFGSDSNDTGREIALDASSRVYVVGTFRSGEQDSQAILASFESNTVSARWTTLIGGNAIDEGNSITIDSYNNVLVTGYFRNTLYFGDTNTALSSPTGDLSTFVIKANANGQLTWAQKLSSNGLISGSAIGNSISADQIGNILVSGYFSGRVDFDPGNSEYALTSQGSNDGFIVKLSDSGQLVWSKTIGGSATDKIVSNRITSNGNIFISGGFKETADLGLAEYSASNFTSRGGLDAFINRLPADQSVNCSISGNFTVSSKEVINGSNCQGVAAIPSGVLAVGTDAFKNSTGLTNVNIPNTVTAIGSGAFLGTPLTSVILPTSLNTIYKFAFASTTLTAINIPASVSLIGDSAFYNNTLLTNITFSQNSNLSFIDVEAFRGNTSLTEISIPENVSWIGDAAFYGNTNLASFNFLGNAPATVGANAFSGVKSGATAYVLQGKTGFTKPTWNGLIVSQPEPAPTPVVLIPTYGVFYDGNSVEQTTKPIDYTRYLTQQIAKLSMEIPTRVGHTFSGWNGKADGTGVAYLPGDSISIGTSDVVLYAQWVVNSYKYTIDSNGGPGVGIPQQDIKYGTIVEVPVLKDDQLKLGNEFLSWNSKSDGSGVNYSLSNKFRFPASDLTLYAQWKPKTYKNAYDGNGVRVGRVPKAFAKDFGTNFELGAPSRFFSRRGFSFQGWSESKTGDERIYAPGQTFTQSARNITFYAVWNPNQYQVKFLSSKENPLPNGTFLTGGSIESAPTPKPRKGYTFKGWSNKPSRDQLISFPYSPGVNRNVTLYPIWLKNS